MSTSNKTLQAAEYAEALTLADLPAEALERTKHVILDEVASAFFCARSLAGGLTARYAQSAGGYPEARIYATGAKVSAVNAALANGAAGHGEEVDGAHVIGGHAGAIIVHACVAMAERQRVTGAQLIEAVAAGYDIGVRSLEACGGLFSVKERFKLDSSFLYAFGAAAGAGRLLGLGASQIRHALALVSFGANAPANFYAERRHISKSVCNGQFASSGVAAALMAGCGLEGHDDILGSPYGVFDAWGEPVRAAGFGDDLGQRFAIMGANFKFINAGYPIHAAVEATLRAAAESGAAAADIERIRIGMPSGAKKVVDSRTMHSICVQDNVAAALLLDGIPLRDSPFPKVLEHPDFAQLRGRIELESDADLDRDQPAGRGAVVTVYTGAGSFTARVDAPRGHSTRGGVTWPDLEGTWTEGLPGADVGRMIEIASRLEEIEDVNTFLDAVVG